MLDVMVTLINFDNFMLPSFWYQLLPSIFSTEFKMKLFLGRHLSQNARPGAKLQEKRFRSRRSTSR
jgi:hypothetical protein